MNEPERVFIDGIEWNLYEVFHLDDEGRKFSFHIRAISFEHAACIVDDIRETAWLGGQITGVSK